MLLKVVEHASKKFGFRPGAIYRVVHCTTTKFQILFIHNTLCTFPHSADWCWSFVHNSSGILKYIKSLTVIITYMQGQNTVCSIAVGPLTHQKVHGLRRAQKHIYIYIYIYIYIHRYLYIIYTNNECTVFTTSMKSNSLLTNIGHFKNKISLFQW